ncbi:MAG: DUF5916 domain-containing protein [Gemmatimonadales bacterium]
MRPVIAVGWCVTFILGPPLWGQEGRQGQEALAVRANGSVPVIDGRLDDEVWQAAPPITDFVQRDPHEGRAVSESTEVRFLYTNHDLYVGFRGYDREPDQVYGRLVRRDQRTAADYFNLFIDSYRDGRTAFEFAINPSGARRDVYIYNDGAGRDESWDPVYDWATRVDSLGWVVEMRIPFSQLRFTVRDSVAFGVRVRRAINRRNEEANWPFFPRDRAGEVSRYARLVGFTELPSPRRIELLPYTAGSTTLEPQVAGDPFATGRQTAGRFGADLKVGVTSGLTLDLTFNPDFGQVEADPAVVNLTAFETFFPEKRPFFVEGTNLFQFGLAPAQRGEFGFMRGGEEGLVYTRRIGRAPQLAADPHGGYAESVSQTTILGAAKLSGQLGRGWSVGVAQAVTSKEFADIVDSTGAAGRAPIEPLSSYSVLRLQRSVNRGRLAYGAIATGMARSMDEAVFGDLHERALSGGIDLTTRFGGDRFEIDAAIMGSRVEGTPEALVRTQRSSARYFQRPDQTYVTLDSTRTELSGVAGFFRVAKPVGFFTWELQYRTRSPGFEINDMGFQRQSDTHAQRSQIQLRWLQPGQVFRQFQLEVQQRAEFTYGWERTRASVQASASADFLNYWNVSGSVERRLSSFATRLLRGGPAFREPGGYDFRINGRTDYRRKLWVAGMVNRSVEDMSGARSWTGGGRIGFRPPGRFTLTLEGRGGWTTSDRQYVTRRTVSDSTYYLLGHLERRELSLTVRADVAITPRLSLELYAQPFLSAGHYEELRVAADPRAARYADRLDPLESDRMSRPGGGAGVDIDIDRDGTVDFSMSDPDFRIVSLRSNAVLRWEFRPGSTLYLVWQQDRRDRFDDPAFDVQSSAGDLLRATGTHVFAAKIAWWIG